MLFAAVDAVAACRGCPLVSGQNDVALVAAAQITVVFTILYALTFVNGLITKRLLLARETASRQNNDNEKPYDRYTHPDMRNADRLQANFLEWSPIFLGNLWSLAVTGNLTPRCVTASWTYVGLRALYIVLMKRHGVASTGKNTALYPSTMPSYVCLLYLLQHAVRVLFC